MKPEQIVEKIVEETDLDEDEIEEKVEEKMEEFEGLVSEEGAIHLVAKEAGVQIAESGDQALKVENIVPDMRKVNLKARVTNISDINTFERDDDEEDGKVRNMTLGDDTGTIRLTLWDEQTEIADKVDEGDAIGVSGAYTVEDNQGNAELRLGDSAQVKMVDDDEVPEVEAGGSGETTEATIREVRSKNAEYKVQGMVMDVYTSSPFYSTCPECGNTVREDDDGEYVCEEDGEVEPDKALAISIVVDDGTGNTRVVMFRDRARELLDIDEETEKEGDLEAVEKAAADVIGKKIELEGRARYNDYFGTLELIANSFDEIETEEELEEMIEMLEA
ncbi:MAG: ssDNA-binding replication factor A large subunit [Candidatus Nanohaloarchaea archaeon]|jgi:ssDNA-binding replication factor A large subunit